MSHQPSEQQAAIYAEFETGRHNFAVEARAGTGKTTTCKEGIERAPEAKKLYVAFNKKNVKEAEAKIQDPRCEVKSLNSLGYLYVRWALKGTKVTTDDTVEFDRARVALRDVVPPHLGRDLPGLVVSEVVKLVAFVKNTAPFAKRERIEEIMVSRGLGPDERTEARGWAPEFFVNAAARVLELSKLHDAAGRISFNDQLWLPVVMGWVRPLWDLVVVDEAQDMNAVQLLLVKKAYKPRGRIVLVGDPRQAIYGFRGADVGGFERLKKELRCKVFPLTVTYRCPKAVVDVARKLVPDYQAAATAPQGEVRTITDATLLTEVRIGDAVISRKNAPLMGFCLALLKAGTPARIEGRDIGQALLSIVKKLNVSDIKDFVPAVEAWRRRGCDRLAGKDGAEAQVETVCDQAEVLVALGTEVDTVKDVETSINNLFQDSDKNPRPAVVLSSVHRAKGLEWNRTYLLEETFSKRWEAEPSEEANIKYVAITRAKAVMTWVRETTVAAPK